MTNRISDCLAVACLTHKVQHGQVLFNEFAAFQAAYFSDRQTAQSL